MNELEKIKNKLSNETNEDLFYEVIDITSSHNMSPYEETVRDYIFTELAKRLNVQY
jgi:hypothetical protein